MADIKVAIKADDSDVKAKFHEAAEEAKLFSNAVKQSMEAVTAASKNVVSETGLGGLGKLLGAAGLTGAAVEFSHRLVAGFKNAVDAALEFNKQVGQLRSALGVAFGGQAEQWATQIRTISGAMGGFEENIAVFKELLRGGLLPQDALTNLINIQNAAKTLGLSVQDLGEKFAEMKERGEVPERFFKEFPALAPIVRGLGGGERPSVDFMFNRLLPAIAPGGLEAPIRLRSQQSVGGQMASLQEQIQQQWVEIGRDLLPVVNAGLKELKNDMPEITAAFKALGEALQKSIPGFVAFVHEFFGTGERIEHPHTWFGRELHKADKWSGNIENNIWNLFFKPAQFLKEAAEEHKKAAENLKNITHPKGG